MRTYIIGISVVLILAITLGYAARRSPITPEQKMEMRKQQAEEYRKSIESGLRRPSRFADRQQVTRPQSIYIAIAVDETFLYLLDKNGQLSKIAKSGIKASRLR